MTDDDSSRTPPRRTVTTGDDSGLDPRRYAIPFERVWRAAAAALDAEGGRIETEDDTRGVLRAAGETGFPRQRWTAEVRVGLDEDGQTRVDVEVALLEGLDFGRSKRRARRLLSRIDEASGADEHTRLALLGILLAAGVLAAGACADDPPPEPRSEREEEPAAVPTPAAEPLRTYERAFAFRATDSDSTLAVVWLFETEDFGDTLTRHVRGLLLRGGVWDPFLEVGEQDVSLESPWRIVPSGPLRLVAGTGDRVDHVVYEQGDRLLDLELRGGGAAWTGSRGGTWGVEDAVVVLGDRAVTGRALGISRAWRPEDGPPGDWALLTSGDSIAVVLASTARGRDADAWQGWVLRGDREILLPRVTVEWTETRAFDEARRDVPIAWSLADSDGDLTGSLQVRTVHLRPGTGEGPLLPVDGVIEVEGVVTLEGVERSVTGLLRHRQGATP